MNKSSCMSFMSLCQKNNFVFLFIRQDGGGSENKDLLEMLCTELQVKEVCFETCFSKGIEAHN